jgi:adenosylhomocysteine nucleosidase
MNQITIIAALDREIAPFVNGWKRGVLPCQHRELPCYRNGDLAVVIGGIGARQAELAARAAVAELHPQALISAGLGGAIIRTLKVGSVFVPNLIVDAAMGTEYRCNTGAGVSCGGILVSAPEIAGPESKKSLADRFHALVVDMEAAAVARVASETKTGFFCVKAISDELDSQLPPLNRFVDGSGRFPTSRFVAWATVRPQWWPAVFRLARDSQRATRALCDWLEVHLTSNFVAPPVVTLEGADFPKR